MTTETSKEKSLQARVASITAKLRRYADQNSTPYGRVLTLFLLERAAYRLTTEPSLAPSLIFKGGFVAVRVYASNRFTTDLDAALHGIDHGVTMSLAKGAVEQDIGDGVWFRLDRTSDLTMNGERGGIRLTFRAGLGAAPEKLQKAQIIQIDLSFGLDPVMPSPQVISTPFVFGDGELSWTVYPLETVIAQKLHAIVSRVEGNSRAKDVYDISIFLPRASSEYLAAALKATFAHRKTELPRPLGAKLRAIDQKVLRIAWSNAVVSAAPSAPSFDEALDSIVKLLDEWGH